MSSKDDRDNRSNQLNPNNSAYASSRGGPSSAYDDDDSGAPTLSPNYNHYRSQQPVIRKTGQYGVGIVDQLGQARFFTFTLEASRDNFFYDEQTLITDLEIYFEVFTMHLRWMFSRHFKGSPTLFCLFDGTTSCLPWHVPLDLQNPEQMFGLLANSKLHIPKDVDPEKTIERLRAVLRPPFEDWGSFEVEGRNVSTLKFTYERRCNAAIMGKL